jgi:two-component sensor histidine kinase
LNDLLDNLMHALSSRVRVNRQLMIDPIRIDVESAIALGLMINELTTNALKHAFTNHPSPVFTLSVVRDGDFILIHVSDNGPGYNFQQASGRGFGIRLMQLLLRKLKGTMVQVNPNTIEVKIPGTCIVG